MKNYLISGAAGFIGSHAVETLLSLQNNRIIGLDNMAYSGQLRNLPPSSDRFKFLKCDISDSKEVIRVLNKANDFFSHEPYSVLNFAAESHVDRSIKSGVPFVKSNVLGVQVLLESSAKLGASKFVQISTDEVYGSLATESASETFRLNPSSPYAASKASADLLALAYFHTHDFPILITRCVNNFGSRQLNEKLIPRFMYLASINRSLPLYGTGQNVREWIPVTLHVKRVLDVLEMGLPGQIYNIGTGYRLKNEEIANMILSNFKTKSEIINIADRLGHDERYAVNTQKGKNHFGWKDLENLESELLNTMQFYWNLFTKEDFDTLKVEEVEGFYK